MTATVADALRLGCSAIGFTIYPGSEDQYEMMEEIREMILEAKSVGLAVVMWSYPRGGKLDKAGETAMDVCAYACHMAALLGAHIIKVKPPMEPLSLDEAYLDVSASAPMVRPASSTSELPWATRSTNLNGPAHTGRVPNFSPSSLWMHPAASVASHARGIDHVRHSSSPTVKLRDGLRSLRNSGERYDLCLALATANPPGLPSARP